jgi:hypothetical protein
MFKLTKFLIALIICMVKVNYSIKDDFGNDIISNNKQLTGVGLGWDYLEDASRYPIFEYVFNNGQTNDGEYKTPDCFVSEDVKKTSQLEESNIIDKATSFVSKIGSISSGSGSRY